MFHQSPQRALAGLFIAFLLLTVPAYAVKNFKVSEYGAGHQIWFEVEDFDERDPADDSSFALSDEPGAFGRSISSVSSNDGASMIRYTFDISKAAGSGGSWYFWGRVINPNNNSDFMLADGHPGDQVPFTLPVSGLVNGQRIFEQSGLGTDWVWAPTAGSAGEEAHTKTLKDGENTMYILPRESGATWDVFMWTDDPGYVPTDADYENASVYIVGEAGRPSPPDGATDVPRDVVLSWTPGEFAPAVNGHRVYLSESFSDVNDGLGGITVSASSFTPAQRLGFDTLYYWRVDEVNAPPDSTVFPGGVWSFTTEPVGYAIENITATASSSGQADLGPEKTIDGSGLNADDLHSTGATDMWLSANEPSGAWIQYEFDQVYKLHEMWVWNSNQVFEPLFGFGMKEVAVEYSTNGTDWTALTGVSEFARAPGTEGYAHNTTIDFAGAVARYVRLTSTSNWGGVLPQYGLSEVRFFYIPVVAREPSPESGVDGLDPDVTLAWRAGREAATHNVYLSTDEQAVIDGNVAAVTVTGASYNATVDLGSTYYWRVDEVNEAETPTTWQGDVWNFSTSEYVVVDNFESYNDIDPPDPESHRIFESWIDGFGVATNGALVGNDLPPYLERAIVHDFSNQSMPLFYDNTGGATYSEAVRTFSPGQDWTRYGVQTLVLYFHGTAGNTGQLYVKVNGVKVPYPGDATDVGKLLWTQWDIDLASLGVNRQSVTTLAIGIDGNGAAGTLYIDDIVLYQSAPEVVVPSEQIWFEAEAADTLTDPFTVGDDPLASGGKYIGTDDSVGDSSDSPPPDGIATYNFTVQGGIYKVSCRIIIPSGDSFWVRIPGATNLTPGEDPDNPGTGWVRWSDPPDSMGWYWYDVFSGDHDAETSNWTLPAGSYTLEIARREDGALMDAIVISKVD